MVDAGADELNEEAEAEKSEHNRRNAGEVVDRDAHDASPRELG